MTLESEKALRTTVAKDATDAQWKFFLDFCARRGLDAYTKQVHWTRQGVITGIDGFRALAERSGEYRPGETKYDVDGRSVIAAHVTVYRRYDGEWHPLTESAYMEEYKASSPLWAKMPRVMLAKVAEARALRRAFPSVFSGIYSPEEMDQAQPRATKETGSEPEASPAEQYTATVCARILQAETIDGIGKILAGEEKKLLRLQKQYPDLHAAVGAAVASRTEILRPDDAVSVQVDIVGEV